MIVRIACLLGILLIAATVAPARDIFVDNMAGDDTFSGVQTKNLPDRSGPVRTIARAIQLATAGDRIVLAATDEPYRESISLVGNRHSGYFRRPFALEGNGAILDGSEPVPQQSWQHFEGAVFRFRPPRLGHGRLFIDDLPATEAVLGELGNNPAKLPKLQWCFKDSHIYFCVDGDRLPSDYRLTYARLQTGITLFHVRRLVIANLIVQGFQLDGISAFNSARDVRLEGVIARGNGRSGVSVGGASLVKLIDCTIGDNGRAQLLTLPHGKTSLDKCRLLGNTAPAWVDRGGRVQIDGQRVEGGIEQPAAEPQP